MLVEAEFSSGASLSSTMGAMKIRLEKEEMIGSFASLLSTLLLLVSREEPGAECVLSARVLT